MIKSLFIESIDANLLELVHLSNSFKRLSHSTECFIEGQLIHSTMHIEEIAVTESGQRVTVTGTLSTAGTAVVELTSQFLFRGHSNSSSSYLRQHSDTRVAGLDTNERLSILKSKNWIQWKQEPALHDSLLFSTLSIETSQPHSSKLSISVTGTVNKLLPSGYVSLAILSVTCHSLYPLYLSIYLSLVINSIPTERSR